jgi:hypothetical protein
MGHPEVEERERDLPEAQLKGGEREREREGGRETRTE